MTTLRKTKGALETRIPPPLIGLVAGLVMWLVARATPALAVTVPARRALAVLLGLAGLAVVAAGVVRFRHARTTVNPLDPAAASALVESGVYRITRNPMYLGFAVVLLGWVVHLASPPAVLGVVAFVAYMNRFQIIPEERALRANFPGAFDAYARKVRRWL